MTPFRPIYRSMLQHVHTLALIEPDIRVKRVDQNDVGYVSNAIRDIANYIAALQVYFEDVLAVNLARGAKLDDIYHLKNEMYCQPEYPISL